jgi:hypothetical protein
LACFEVLKMRMFERFDGSEPRVRAFASKLAKIPGFIRAAPYPSDQLKLFSASAVERHGVAFCWLLILAKQNK